jgi:hypothetical protein
MAFTGKPDKTSASSEANRWATDKMNFFKKLFGIKYKNVQITFGKVEFDDDKVVYYHPQDEPQSIKWDQLDEVGIVTTDEGPYNEDLYFILMDSTQQNGCAIPQGADGVDALIKRLQELDNFSNEELIKAMGCTDNSRFILWQSH